MKIVTLILAMFVVNFAYASEKVIVEFQKPMFARALKASFQINRDLGRAWVEVSNHILIPKQEQHKFTKRFKVEGLSFDNVTNLIVMDGAECAKVEKRGRGIFSSDKISNTGCQLALKEVMKEVDDGFEVRQVKMLQVVLTQE